jgi:hypothetical protein
MPYDLPGSGLGFEVQGLMFRFRGLGFGLSLRSELSRDAAGPASTDDSLKRHAHELIGPRGLGFRAHGFGVGCRVKGSGCRV